jgi:hypothetical protein
LEVPVAQSLIFCVVCYRSLFVLLSLYCLSFDLQLFITTFVSSNFAYRIHIINITS